MDAWIDGETPRFMIYDAEALLLASLFLILLFFSSRFLIYAVVKIKHKIKNMKIKSCKKQAVRRDVIKSFFYY